MWNKQESETGGKGGDVKNWKDRAGKMPEEGERLAEQRCEWLVDRDGEAPREWPQGESEHQREGKRVEREREKQS